MFIYADESGHSGRYIFNEPTNYFQGAILSVTDPEPLLINLGEKYCQDLGIKRLHANELEIQLVERIASEFLDLLEKTDWIFHLTLIEKPYLVITKFVDSIFDSYENLGARWLWYNHELFRHALCNLFNIVLSEQKKKEFWDAYLKDDYSKIVSIVEWTLSMLDNYNIDKRLKEVASDGLNFAMKYPEEITLMASRTRKSYKGHTPNMVAFSSLIHAIHKFCKENNVKPEAFIHDPQSEFGTTMKEYHKIFASVRMSENIYGFFPTPESVDYDLGKFALTPSKYLTSLQAVDLFIWLSQRRDRIKSLELKQHLFDKTDPYYISHAMSQLMIQGWLYKLAKAPLTEEQIKKAQEQVDQMENIHKQRLK